MGAVPIVAGIGAGLGLIKHNQAVGKYNRDKQLAADIERNSSWTGVHGQMPGEPNSSFGDLLQGGLGGAMFGTNFMKGGAFNPNAPNTEEDAKILDSIGKDPTFSPEGNKMVGGYEKINGANILLPMSGSSWDPRIFQGGAPVGTLAGPRIIG